MPGLDKRVQSDVIFVSERFSIWRDQYQWFLYDFHESRYRKDGIEKKIPGPTYHPKLSQLVSFMVEAKIKEATALNQIVDYTNEIKRDILQHMKTVTVLWGKTPSDTCEKEEEDPFDDKESPA